MSTRFNPPLLFLVTMCASEHNGPDIFGRIWARSQR